jgi:hypothetical protein
MIIAFPEGIKSQALNEYQDQRGSKYIIHCSDGDIKLGKYVLPSKCQYFTEQINLTKEQNRASDLKTPSIELDCCRQFPKQLMQVK